MRGCPPWEERAMLVTQAPSWKQKDKLPRSFPSGDADLRSLNNFCHFEEHFISKTVKSHKTQRQRRWVRSNTPTQT